MQYHKPLFSIVVAMLITGGVLPAQPLAFPGAEGGGRFTTGGREGKVLIVDNLNDKGDGSFRKAIEAEGPRTILFRVSGIIELAKPIYIKNGDLTIAGQSAPGDGICLKNFGIRIESNNVIIRFLRVRPGDQSDEELDAISAMGVRNIIIDHCSFSWGTDEAASFYENSHFTFQWCIVSESLFRSVHSKGDHGYGGIWGGNMATFHHNLISDHSSRNPRFHGSRYNNDPELEKVDFRNNVIYNWGNNSIYGGEEGNYNIVNNYFKPGPATKKDVQFRILELTQWFFDSRRNPDTLTAGKFFIKGNRVDGYPKVTRDNWRLGVQGKSTGEAEKAFSKLQQPVAHGTIDTECARKAYRNVLKFAGASLARDAVDQRIVAEAGSATERYGTTFGGGGKGIIDTPSEVGGWPVLAATRPLPDSDGDGMPDGWETENGLNPEDPADGNQVSSDGGYTHLEIYLNGLVKQTFRKL